MRIRAAALLLLLAVPAPAATAMPDHVGEGAQRLVMGAVRAVRREWRDDVCFAGIKAVVNVNPSEKHHWKTFFFKFAAPGYPNLQQITYSEWIGRPDTSPFANPERFNNYRELKPDALSTSANTSCITDMEVDSGKALGIAIRNGLAERTRYELHLYLVKEHLKEWKLRSMRNRNVWRVQDETKIVYVDAANGKVLKVMPLREL